MTRFSTLALLGTAATIGLSAPAAAQHAGHSTQPATPAQPTCLPEHAAMGHCTLPTAPRAASQPPATPQARSEPSTSAPVTCLPEHAEMGHCTLPAAPKPATTSPPGSQPSTSAGATCLPEHAAMGHCTLPATSRPLPPPSRPTVGSSAPAQATCLPEHAAMGHCTLPAAPAQSQSVTPQRPACAPEHAAMGHCTPAAPQQVAQGASGTDLPATDSPAPPIPTDHAADAIYGAQAMEMGRHHLIEYHGGQKFSQVMLNVAEVQWRKGRQAYEWDGEAWYGGDIGRFVLKSEGEGEFRGSLEKVETQALYSHAIGPYWNLQGGVRYDIRPNPSRAYATIGVEGLAPSFFDVEAAVFLSNKGELLGKLEGYYDQRITQRLILQPRAELNFAAQDTPELKTGAGLTDAEVGLRLRYDIRREFSPYVGVQYRRAFGESRRFLRADGEDATSWSILTGIRMWF